MGRAAAGRDGVTVLDLGLWGGCGEQRAQRQGGLCPQISQMVADGEKANGWAASLASKGSRFFLTTEYTEYTEESQGIFFVYFVYFVVVQGIGNLWGLVLLDAACGL